LSNQHGLSSFGAYIDGLLFFTSTTAVLCKEVGLSVPGLFNEPQTIKERDNF